MDDAVIRGEALLRAGRQFGGRPGLLARMFWPRLDRLLDQIDAGLAAGTLHGTLPDGTRRTLGGRAPGFACEVTLHDWRGLLRVAMGGSVGLYEAWEAGEWSSPDPVQLFALFMANSASLGDAARAKGLRRWLGRALHWLRRNTRAGAEKNIHAHYDLGNDFYAAWLDELMVYSSGFSGGFAGPNIYAQMCDDLAYFQLSKITAIRNRICLRRGDIETVLEIGCGWGSLAAILGAQGLHVDAISISDAQLAWAREKLPANTAGTVDYRKQDYRDTNGQYDAIVSVEMVEALGREYWPAFMDCIVRNLKPGGKAAIQYIAIRDDLFDAYASSVDFIQAYVFPGGMLLRTSEFRALAELRGLRWQDQVDFPLDYAETLKIWRERFDLAAGESRLPDSFDARFCNLWRFYLMYCEGGFRGGGITVSQVTLVKE